MAIEGKKLVRNSLFNLTTFVNQLFLGVVLVPFIVRHLGDTTYGVWALISAVLSYSTLLTMSLNSGVTRWIPMLLVAKDTDGVNRVASTAHMAFSASAAVTLVAIAVLAVAFPDFFVVPDELAFDAQVSTAIVGVGFYLVVQLSVYGGVLTALERYDLFAASEATRAAVQILGVIVVLIADGGLVELAIVYGLANAARAVLAWGLARRAFPELEIRRRSASFALFREMLAFSVNTFLYRVYEVIARQMGLVLIGALLTAAAVTEFAIPTVLVGVVLALIAQTANVMKPAVSRLDAADEHESVRTLFLGGSKVGLLIAIPMGAVLALYSDRILELWLQDAYPPNTAEILSVMAVAAVFRALVRPAFFVVEGLGLHRVFGRVAMAQVSLGSVLAFLALSVLDLGTVGVAWAFAVPEILSTVFVLVPYSARAVGLDLRSLARTALLPAVVANLPVLVVLVGLETFLRGFEGLAFVGVMAVVGLLVPAGAWLFALTPREKKMLLSLVRLA